MIGMILLLFLPLTVVAEQEYFTWVDAQGRIHNTQVERVPIKKSDKSESSLGTAHQPQRIDSEFLTEEQLQQKLKKEKQENPPFYTYVDADGQVKSKAIIDAQIEVEKPYVPVVYDHILAPPFRVSQSMSEGCCQRYQSYFKENIPEEKSVLFSGFLNSVPVLTRFGARKAWYFNIDGFSDFRELSLKIRHAGDHTDHIPAAIFTDQKRRALYFIPQLSLVNNPASWSGTAYKESSIKLDDVDVASVIVYFPQHAPTDASLEVNWRHGKASD